MATLASHLVAAVALAFVLQACQAQTAGNCSHDPTSSYSQSYVTYISQLYDSCTRNWRGSRRCRQKYRLVSKVSFRTVCCTGYQYRKVDAQCIPICNDCDANHTCIAPDTCVCPTGWTGPDCQRDVDECNQAGLCEQNCNNSIGSYSCSCDSDYNLAADLHSCLGMPENIVFDTTGSRTMTLSWDPPVADSRDGTVLSYSISCSSNFHMEFSLRQIITVPAQSVPMTSLNPFTSYNCCIATQTTNGNGPYRCNSGVTLEDAPADPPTIVTVTNTSAYSLFIKWDPPNTPNGMLVNYTIYLDYNNGTTDARITDFNAMAYLLKGLSPHQLVGVEITANTSVGEGPRSPIQEIRTHQAVPTPVTALEARGISNSSLQVTWELPSVLNGILVYYIVNVSSTSIGYFEVWRVEYDDPLQLNIMDLEPYVPYTIQISAATHAGEGDVNTIIQFTKEGIPDVPAVVYLNRVSATEIRLIWNPLTLEESRGFPLSYTVAYSSTEQTTCPEVGPETNTIIVTHSGNSQPISNLDPRLEYCVAIAASTVAGTSDFSDAKKVPLFSNNLFQVRLSGIHTCTEWVLNNSLEKLSDLMKLLVLQLMSSCECALTTRYIADGRFICNPEKPGEVIFQGRIMSVTEKNSTDLMEMLQGWVLDQPTVVVQGVQLKVESECSVELQTLGDTECRPLTDDNSPEGLSSPVGGGVGGVLVIVVLAVIVVGVLICVKKMKPKKRVTISHEYEKPESYVLYEEVKT